MGIWLPRSKSILKKGKEVLTSRKEKPRLWSMLTCSAQATAAARVSLTGFV